MYECTLDSHTYSHLISDQGDMTVLSGKDSIFNKWSGSISIGKKKKLILIPTSHHTQKSS